MNVVNRWHAPALTEEQHERLLRQAISRAWHSPFMAAKLRSAGLELGETIGQAQWHTIPLTTKDELRTLSLDEFYRDFVIAPPEDIADYWRSGGVTGKPLFYPRTREDVVVGIETVCRLLEMAGLGPGNKVAMSYPLGVHPLGRLMLLALQAQGVATLGMGAGNNTPTEQQLEIITSLKVDTLLAMGTYAAQMANIAANRGIDLASSGVSRIISCSDMTLPAKRQRIERLWGAEYYDFYGMSECGHLAGECSRHDGMHIWADLFHLEVLDPDTWQPVAPGEVGVLVATPLYTNHATPFLRWVSGDIVTLTDGCDCGSPYGHFPLLHLAGRTSGFFKLRGVNINHNELEEKLLTLDDVSDYLVTALIEDDVEILRIEVETRSGALEQEACTRVHEHVTHTFGLAPDVRRVPPGSIESRLAAQVKQNRVFDHRFVQ